MIWGRRGRRAELYCTDVIMWYCRRATYPDFHQIIIQPAHYTADWVGHIIKKSRRDHNLCKYEKYDHCISNNLCFKIFAKFNNISKNFILIIICFMHIIISFSTFHSSLQMVRLNPQPKKYYPTN